MKKTTRNLFLAFAVICTLTLSCGVLADAGPPEEYLAVPSGDPPFPSFQDSWVIDTTSTVSQEVILQSNEIFNGLRNDGIAEVVILIINGVGQPELYATRFGRHIELGSTETDNGLVYLLRPDGGQDEHIIYSVGRGLPAFTSARVTDATQGASVKANQGNYNEAVLSIAQDTDNVLRMLYEPNPETLTEEKDVEDEDGLTPKQKETLITTSLIVVAIWFVIGLGLMLLNVELGLNWWLIGFRIFVLVISMGKVNVGTGGSGKFGGRSGSR